MDWIGILNQLIDLLLPTFATILIGVFTYLGTKLKGVYETKVNNDTAKAVVNDVVQFVQQVYGDLDGPTKLQKAIEQVSQILASKGITLSETEINMLIESAVYGIKQGAECNMALLPEAQVSETVTIEEKEEQETVG